MLVNTIVEGKVEQLWDVAKRLAMALDATGIPYRVIGGFAIFVHVDRVDPIAARVTRDVDVANEDAAGIRPMKTGDGLEQHRLA